VPCTITAAPVTGAPVGSVTFPEILCCPMAMAGNSPQAANDSISKTIRFDLFITVNSYGYYLVCPYLRAKPFTKLGLCRELIASQIERFRTFFRHAFGRVRSFMYFYDTINRT